MRTTTSLILFLLLLATGTVLAALCGKPIVSLDVLPSSWCASHNPFIVPYLFSDEHFAANFTCESNEPQADCFSIVSVGTYEKADKSRYVSFAMFNGDIISIDFNTYKVLSYTKFNKTGVLFFESLNNDVHAMATATQVIQYHSIDAVMTEYQQQNYNPELFFVKQLKYLRLPNNGYMLVTLLKKVNSINDYVIRFDNQTTTLEWQIVSPAEHGTIEFRIFEHVGNFTSNVLKTTSSASMKRVMFEIYSDLEVKLVTFDGKSRTITFGGADRLNTFYTTASNDVIIDFSDVFGESFRRPNLTSSYCGNTVSPPAMNMFLLLGLTDRNTGKSSFVVKHLPEFSYYNFLLPEEENNPAQRPSNFNCPANQYYVGGRCVTSRESVFSLNSPALFIKARFIDVPETLKTVNAYKPDGSLNVALACDLAAFANPAAYQGCMQTVATTMSCEVDMIKRPENKQYSSTLFSTYLYTAIFVGDLSNKITVFATQPDFDSTDAIFVEQINEVAFIGGLKDIHNSGNGQHMFVSVTRKKWELDSMNRLIDVCAKLRKTLPNDINYRFLEPFTEACSKMPPSTKVDLNMFGQYVSNCLPGVLCAELKKTSVYPVDDGYYAPRPNLNLTCPIGSFCRSGTKRDCPIGFYCDIEKLATPKRCNRDNTLRSTCFGEGNKAPANCPSGSLCIAPYFPPLPSPPNHFISETYSLEKCKLGDYCNLGRSASTSNTTSLRCPALTFCSSPDIMVPTVCQCNITGCAYCTAGSSFEQPCPKGYVCRINELTLEPIIEPCLNRTFCDSNSVQPKLCPAGWYCPTPSEKVRCPAGFYCRPGSLQPSKCTALSFCGEGSENDQVNFIGFTLIILSAIALVLLYNIIFFIKRKIDRAREKAKQKKPAHELLGIGDSVYLKVQEEASAPFTMDVRCENLGLVVNGNKTVLNNVNAEFKKGTLTAVMGPSGCGKSSFLTTLADLAFYGKRLGKVFVNDKETSLTNFSNLVGFVPQEDIMIRTATVYETLYFSARNRLDWKKTPAEISQVVERVIEMLGLQDIRGSLIGDEKRRGISGGQRKRVNIGMELVAQPSVLLLDEPTSGLDSFASQEVCSALQKIAATGITVMTVIHQPRYEIFEMFDNVLLLAKGGWTIYYGPAKKVMDYFENLGYACPARVNPSDFFLDIISGVAKSSKNADWKAQQLIDYWASEGAAQVVDQSQYKPPSLDVSSQASIQEPPKAAMKPYAKRSTSFFVQFFMCWLRAIIQQIRDWSGFFVDNILIFIGAFFLSISIFGEVFEGAMPDRVCTILPEQLRGFCSVPVNDLPFRTAALIPLILMLAGTMASLSCFGNESVVYLRESMGGLNSLAYFVGKNISQIPNLVVAPLVFLAIYCTLAAPRASFFMYYWVLLVIYFVAYGLGYLLSMIFRPGISHLAGVVVCLSLMQFAGSQPLLKALYENKFYPLRIMPYISMLRWAQELVYVIEIREYAKLDVYEIQKGMNLYSYTYDAMWQNSLILVFGYGIGLRICAYIVLWQSKPNSIFSKSINLVKDALHRFREGLARCYVRACFKSAAEPLDQ